MTRKYSLVIGGNEAGYSAYVPELPTIYWTALQADRLPTSLVKEIEVELPA